MARKRRGAPIDHRKCKREQQKGTPFDYHPDQAQSTQQLPVDFLINLNALFTNENSGDRSQMSDSTKGETSGGDSASNSHASVKTNPVKFLIDLDMAEEASMSFTLTGQPIQSWIEKEARKNQRTVNPGHGKSRCAICQIDLQIKYEDHREMASHKTTFINSLTSAFHKSLKTRAKPETTH